MSRLTVRKTGVIFVVVALVLAVTAGSAAGWYDQPTQPSKEHEKGEDKDDEKGKDKDRDKGGKHEEKPPPVTPPTTTTPPPAPPTAVTPPPPVVSQGAPPAPEQPVGVETTPQQPERPETVGPTVAQAPSQPLAPVAEREALAKTGIDPGLVAVLGAMFLVGGGFLFRRAFARG